MPRRGLLLGVLAAVAAAGLPAAAHAAPTITELSAGSGPLGLAQGADGNVWFTDNPNPGVLGRVTPSGTATTFSSGLTNDGKPTGITAGPGGLWFTLEGKNTIGRITTAGTIAQFPGASHDHPTGITAGPDGNLWYVATGHHGAVIRMTPTGTTTEFTTGLTPDGNPRSITLGPDGNLWFTAPGKKRVGRITPQGSITEFGTGLLGGTPQEITAGPDGNLWFTENGIAPGVARITTSGVITEFSTGLPLGSAPQAIATGADGNLYFTDPGANAIGRVTTSGAITTYTSGLTAGANLQGITSGGDGRIWFAEEALGKIGRISVAPTAGAVVESSVTDTAATVDGTVSPNSEATTYTFEYGTTTSYGQSTTPASAGSGGTAQAVSASLTLLSASTTYHVRLVATNPTGTTYGPDRSFTTTAPGAPSATSLPPSGVTATTATLAATVNPENAATTYHFEWGTTTAPYPNRIPAGEETVGSDGTNHALAKALTGLEPNTTYHFRVVATSPSGTTSGADETFTTDAVVPEAATSAATDITTGGATLGATVDPRNSATAYRFEWGTTTYGAAVPDLDELVGDDHATHAVTKVVTGLQPSTTYHFRVVATSNAGVTTGTDQTFTTAAATQQTTSVTPTPAGTADELRPELGRTAVASVARGVVRVKLPGSNTYVTLDRAGTVPAGATVDTRNGVLGLVSVLDAAGHTQTARFRGAVFRIGLSTSGMVDLYLTGTPTRCGKKRWSAQSAAKRKPPTKLWGKDSHGKYRTHGRNSVAIVRGTEWTTTETCAGTMTRVVSGAVSVWDRATRKRQTVRAGHSYLARRPT